MKQNTEIRPAELADMGAVGRLYTDSWQRTYRGLIPDWVLDEMTPEKSRDKWTRYREQKENGLFVLERDGAVAGLVACRPFPERENSALLDSLHVAPEAQAHRPGGPVGSGARVSVAGHFCGPWQPPGGAALPGHGGEGALRLPRLGRRALLGPGLGGLGEPGADIFLNIPRGARESFIMLQAADGRLSAWRERGTGYDTDRAGAGVPGQGRGHGGL